MALVLIVSVLLIGALPGWWPQNGAQAEKVWWAMVSAIAGVGMFYRYLKFFRHYALEVFTSYAEVD